MLFYDNVYIEYYSMISYVPQHAKHEYAKQMVSPQGVHGARGARATLWGEYQDTRANSFTKVFKSDNWLFVKNVFEW